MKQLKTGISPQSILVATVIASSMILAPTAQAFEFKTSGQVSRMVVAPDAAVGDEIQHLDIGFSGSRFRFTGSEEMANGMTVGFKYEIQARRGAPEDGANLDDGGDNQENRLQDVFFKGDFGQISIGRGDGAGNGATEVDLSGTVLASPSSMDSNWGNFKITPDTDADPVDSNAQAWSSVYTMFDANSRENRVRYDSPSFNGVSFAVSTNQGNANELAVRYKGAIGDHKFGAAYYTGSDADNTTGNTTATTVITDGEDISGGSASLLLNNGFNFTVAISEKDVGTAGATREATFFKVGYKAGKHAFTIDQADGERSDNLEEGDSTGFTYAFFPHKGVELFATIRTLDSTGVAGAQSVDITAIGTRLKF